MLNDDDILAIVSTELAQADNTLNIGQTTLEDSLDLYLGNPNGTEIEGRSQVVSTDIADAIEWILPQIMKSFTQNNEIVKFDPVREGDEFQAELESEYVYEILMKQNNGFILLHQFVKDALMQQNGILKVYYAKKEQVKTFKHTGITEEALNQLLSMPNIDLLEMTEYIDQNLTDQKKEAISLQMKMVAESPEVPIQDIQRLEQEYEIPVMLYDVTIGLKLEKGQVYVDGVPPEEFRVTTQHNSICLDEARFTAQVLEKTLSELNEEYDLSKEDIEKLESGNKWLDKDYRFAAQGEDIDNDNYSLDKSLRLIEIAECYMLIDVEETGIAKLMKITVAGGDSPTLILDKEELDMMPWVSTTTFLMSHKFRGLSITDRLKQIQAQKTALLRSTYDNIYLQNNQRTVVIENQVNIDDVMVSRPGGVIRAKRLDAVAPLVTPSIGQDAFTMMNYLDSIRAGRVGVDADGTATPQNIGDRVGSQGIERLMNAKEELVGLIIRVVAETGVKPLCVKIRDLAVQHIDAVHDFKFRDVWYKINPAKWHDRVYCTVRVGTGSGNQAQQLAAVTQVLEYQQKLADLGVALINEPKVYNALDDFCKFSGLNGATRYFVDPASPEGKQLAQQKQLQDQQNQEQQNQIQQSLAAAQNKIAQAEQDKVEVQRVNTQLKADNDMIKNQLQLDKQISEAESKLLKQQLDEANLIINKIKSDDELKFKYDQLTATTAVNLTQQETTSGEDVSADYEENKASVENE